MLGHGPVLDLSTAVALQPQVAKACFFLVGLKLPGSRRGSQKPRSYGAKVDKSPRPCKNATLLHPSEDLRSADSCTRDMPDHSL